MTHYCNGTDTCRGSWHEWPCPKSFEAEARKKDALALFQEVFANRGCLIAEREDGAVNDAVVDFVRALNERGLVA